MSGGTVYVSKIWGENVFKFFASPTHISCVFNTKLALLGIGNDQRTLCFNTFLTHAFIAAIFSAATWQNSIDPLSLVTVIQAQNVQILYAFLFAKAHLTTPKLF